MYKIYVDGQLFYDPRIPALGLSDLSLEMEVNKTGTLKMTIPATHPQISNLTRMYSELSVYQDGEWIWSGRVCSDDYDFYGNRTVECEGELSYLLDSIQRYHEYHDISVSDYFSDLITKHNSDVDERKQFTLGQVTVEDSNDSLYRYSTYETTWRTIDDRLISRLGGYVRTRHENGHRYIDYIEGFGNINTQVIRFGENILDLIREVTCEDLATVIIPLGKKDDETDERLTISSVNDGKDYVEDPDAIARYGRIVKIVEYDDVTLPENLLRKGNEVLNRQSILITSVTITAIDLHLLSVSVERCKVGDSIRVVSEPHGIDEYMMIQRLFLDLLHPENSKLTLGTTGATLAGSMSRSTAAAISSMSDNITTFKRVVAGRLQAFDARIETLRVDQAQITLLLAQKANVVDLNAISANVSNLTAAQAELGRVVAGKAEVSDLEAVRADVSELDATAANISSLLAGNAGVGQLQAIHLSGDNIVIDDATIAEAVIADLMAGNVTAASIYTDYVKICSRDGSLSIDGATIQIKDTSGTVRVQIGKDGSGNYSYYLWNENGDLIWSPEGIQAAGVPDGLIINDMVADDAAIDGSKLNIRSVATALNNDGSIEVDAAHVQLDDTTLDAAYTSVRQIVTDTSSRTSTLETEMEVVQGQIDQRIWKTDIKDATDPLGTQITQISDRYATQQQTIDGITQEIGSVKTTLATKADGAVVDTLSSRVNAVEETAGSFTRTISEVQTALAKTITNVETFYMLSTSSTTAPSLDDVAWSLDAPAWEDGKYMWSKTVTTYTDETTDTEGPVCLSGTAGADGEDAILLRIDSSRGTVFKNSAVSTVLSVIIYHGGNRIETSSQLSAEFGAGAYLQWEWLRLGDDTYGTILATDSRLSDKGFHFTLSPEDVDAKVTFRCNLMI